jgi:hypothetical protein
MDASMTIRPTVVLLLLPLWAVGVDLCRAGEEVTWSAEVGGLRIGITCDSPITSADCQPVFTVQLQNRSQVALTLPEPTAFVERSRPDVRGRREWPLKPQIDVQDGPKDTYYQRGGEPLADAKLRVFTILPGEARTLVGYLGTVTDYS